MIAGIWFIVSCKYAPNGVFIKLQTERQVDLLGNSRASESGITLFHLHDRIDHFSGWSFGARLLSTRSRIEITILALSERSVKFQQSRGFDNNAQSSDTPGIQKDGQEPKLDTVLGSQVGGTSPGPVMNNQLLSQKEIFRNDCSASTRPDQLRQGSEQVEQQVSSAFHAVKSNIPEPKLQPTTV